MSENTNIEWCDHTFNPWIGCTKISPGCDNCYAATQDKFRKWTPAGWGGERRRTGVSNWRKPIQWQAKAGEFMAQHGRRQRVFCASLADVFDNQVPDAWRRDLFALIAATPDLDWLLLTKRIGNAHRMLPPDWVAAPPGREIPRMPDNVWIGATITSQAEADRDIPKLLAVPARVRFLSMEPLLGPVDLAWVDDGAAHRDVPREEWGSADDDDCPPGLWWNVLSGKRTIMHGGATGEWSRRDASIDWVIAGGESGPGARPMHPDWARSLRDQCAAAGVPFLFKQWGEWGPFVNEAHYTHGGAEKHAHAWVDAETADHGLCWIVDDDGLWSNWTGEPRKLPEGEEDDQGGNLHEAVTVMGHHGKKAAGRLLDGAQHDGFPGNAT